MSEEIQTGVNEQEAAAPVNTEQVQQTEATSVKTPEVAAPADNKPVQTPEDNARYAEIRRNAEKEAKDNLVKEMYGKSHGITTYEQYQQALRQQELAQEAERQGTDVRVLQLEERLGSIEFEKTLIQQDHTLSNDPKIGEYYKQLKPEIDQMVQQLPNVDYDTAFTVLFRQKGPELITNALKNGEQEAIKKISQNGQTSPGALGNGAIEHTTSIAKMSDKDFKTLQDRVLRGEKVQF